MWNVPNYQVIEFLDWLEQNHIKIELNKKEEIVNYAHRYLIEQTEGDHFAIKRALKLFQYICIVEYNENRFDDWLHHFCHLRYMPHELTYRNYKNYTEEFEHISIGLHPFLENFHTYLINNEFQFSEIFQTDLYDYRLFERLINSEWDYKFHKLLDRYVHNASEESINDFRIFCKEENSKIEKFRQNNIHNERDGQLNTHKYGIKAESERLANSLEYFIYNNERPLKFLSVIKDDYPVVISFFGWIIEKYPHIKSLNDIPYQKIEDEIDLFCDKHSYGEVVKLKRQINKLFNGQIDENLLDKIKRWFLKEGKENPFNRYQNIDFHGIFLFPYFNSEKYKDFINDAWYDLNSFTSNHIDIYYSSEDLEKKNGFDVLNELKGFNNIRITDLPAFLIWDKSLSNVLSIPLAELEKEQIFKVMQCVVQSIIEKKPLSEIAQGALDYINQELNKVKQIQYYVMGDNFNFQGAANFTFVNKSIVENSFNKIKGQFDENTANVIKEIAGIVEKSANSEAKELFEAFSNEINKPEPKKSLLKTFWTGLTSALPILASTASITASILKIIG